MDSVEGPDQLLIRLPGRLYVGPVRRSGRTVRLVADRLAESADDGCRGAVRVLAGPNQHAGSLQRLLKLGARLVSSPQPVARQLETSLCPPDLDQFVAHWTRRRRGPWPEQSESEYLDQLLLAPERADHSALAALVRILTGGRVIASPAGLRQGHPAVCFTDVPLNEWLDRRVFRRHRQTWDFEHYGICIRRQRLAELGARPVIYGEKSDWAGLCESDRPFFQRASTNYGQIDWRAEREWRLLADLDLWRVPPEDILVFVASSADLPALPCLPWRVVCLSQFAAATVEPGKKVTERPKI